MSNDYNPYKTYDVPDGGDQSLPPAEISWRDVPNQARLKYAGLHLAELVLAIAWGLSIGIVNPIASNLFLADIMPFTLPQTLENFTVSHLINFGLGLLAVILPMVMWKFALEHNILKNPRAYFAENPLRITVGSLLVVAYLLIVTLEILALSTRISEQIDTGPIPVLGDKADILPLTIASAALILGSNLLGLATASLSKSLRTHYRLRNEL